jgi:hypothetical protein
MRLWSIHPKYLDAKGLVACWREALLGQAVLSGKTKGYTNHPQLDRFKNSHNPSQAMSNYLWTIIFEADRRGFQFDKAKIAYSYDQYAYPSTAITKGQLEYEFEHLERKLFIRNKKQFLINEKVYQKDNIVDPNSWFVVIDGPVEPWEKV